jgi:hypothetical protein
MRSWVDHFQRLLTQGWLQEGEGMHKIGRVNCKLQSDKPAK